MLMLRSHRSALLCKGGGVGGPMGMVIVEMRSAIAFLCSLRYGGELFQILPNLQRVRVPSETRASFMPYAVVVSSLAMTQAMALGASFS